MKFMYKTGFIGTKSRPASDSTRVLINPSPSAANTRGDTPRKDKGKTQVADKGKFKVMDKGKGKMIEPEKPAFIPLQIGEALKIYKLKDLVSPTPSATEPAKKSLVVKRKLVDKPPRVARVLKLVDEAKDSEAQQPLEAPSGPISTTQNPGEKLDIEVIEAPFVKKMRLTKVVEAVAPPVGEAQNVANFLAAQRKLRPSWPTSQSR
jgi:hypothetical protein